MKIAKTSRILTSIESWSQLPDGECLLKQTQYRLDHTLPRCFGYHLLKLGQLSSQLSTAKSPIIHQINCAPSGEDIGLFADLHLLPVQDSSIDLCLLAHELDFSSDPHQLLREIDRVLTLDGTLIISGYNPISLFGLRSVLTPKRPHTARLFLLNRILDWLHLLGFEVQQKQQFDFLSCNTSNRLVNCIENIGERLFPFFCSNYFIVAKKQSIPMTRIKSPFKFAKPIMSKQPIATRNNRDLR
ncbi:methyltransferase [Psychromonas marina]|uniref:Methyltransferase n=1 Tax=Psychromonas marina TaxID=88364 RepID=A0ABQ6DWR0_9GAMM|nr:methyltransferase domain-containing protein [Psychromonas marina]GLS89598.1 methyltransferase [Psychromonas marina]